MHEELESLSAPDVSSFRFKIEEADDLVAISCLKYLHYFDRLERRYKRYPLREYAWYNWEKHVHVEGYILRESAFLRRKAVKLYQVLGSHRPQRGLAFNRAMQLATACFRTSQHRRASEFCPVAPEEWKESLMKSLNIPYFHPYFDDFELGSDHNNVRSAATLVEGQPLACSPLDRTQEQIQIFTVLPSLDLDTEVRCRMLISVNLDEADNYVVVSYSWGSPEKTENMRFDGFTLQVTHTIITVLPNLRCHQETRMSHLWIDFICINQNDRSESLDQICLTPWILRRVQEVVLVLGVEDEHHETGIESWNSLLHCHLLLVATNDPNNRIQGPAE
jgi:hypothetical protein